MDLLVLIDQCSPNIHPQTMMAIVKKESGGNPYALHDNGSGKSYFPKTYEEAVALTIQLISSGRSVDIGLAQINSKNLPRLGYSVNQILDPCTNLKASEKILLDGWNRSGGHLKKTLSVYNTGKTNSSVGYQYAHDVTSKAKKYIVPSVLEGTPGTKNEEDSVEFSVEKIQSNTISHDYYASSLTPEWR